MKLISGSLLVTLVSTTAWAAAPTAPAPVPAPAAAQAAPAVAPSAEQLGLARRFVAATIDEDRFLDLLRMGAVQSATETVQVKAAAANRDPQAAIDQVEAEVDAFLAKVRPSLHALMPRMFEAYGQAYAREFSADELKTMITFAQSPTGHHFLTRVDVVEADPAIMHATMELMQSIVPVMEDMAKDACAKKAAARVAMGDKKATCPLAKAADTRAG